MRPLIAVGLVALPLSLACGGAPSADAPPKKTARTADAAGASAKPAPKKAEAQAAPAAPAPAPTPSDAPAAGGDTALTKAERDAGAIARCADGDLVFGFWQGEYPSPALQLDRPIKAKVAAGPCRDAERACTVAPALLHPWASDADKGGDLRFATRTEAQRYRATRPSSLAGTPVEPGDEMAVLSYLSEGFCLLRFGADVLEGECPGTSDDSPWEALDDAPPSRTQLVRVPCDGGRSGWLTVDAAMQKRPGVREGQITGYGEVSKSP